TDAFVVPDRGGKREESLQHTRRDAGVGASAVTFEIELALEGVVDRLDDLAERLEESGTRAWRTVLVRGTQPRAVMVVEERLELAARVALVGDQSLTGTICEEFGFGLEQVTSDVTFIEFGLVNANVIGRPDTVVIRCRRSPQKNREWLAQYP